MFDHVTSFDSQKYSDGIDAAAPSGVDDQSPSTAQQQVCVQLPMSVDNAALPAFARLLLTARQQSIDISQRCYVGLVAVGVQEQAEDILVPSLLQNCLTLSYISFS